MVEKFGVSLDEDLAARVEELRVRETAAGAPEVAPRSAVVGDLLSLGVVATDVLRRSGLDIESDHARRAFLRQALLNELERQGVPGPERSDDDA